MYLGLIGVTFVLGCAAVGPTVTAPLGEPFQLELDKEALVEGLSVRFAEIVADSRCPAGATCVWAGDAFSVESGSSLVISITAPTGCS